MLRLLRWKPASRPGRLLRLMLAFAFILLSASPDPRMVPVAEAANPSASLDQCANGPLSAPSTCNPNDWVNGNLGSSKAHYYEGDSVA